MEKCWDDSQLRHQFADDDFQGERWLYFYPPRIHILVQGISANETRKTNTS